MIIYWKPEPPEPPPATAAAIRAHEQTIADLRGQMLDTERLWLQVRGVVIAINKLLLRCRVVSLDTWLWRIVRDVLSDYADTLEQELARIDDARRVAYVTRDKLWQGAETIGTARTAA